MNMAIKIEDQLIDVNVAIEDLPAQTYNKLSKAIREWKNVLQQKYLFKRVMEKKKERDSL